MGRLPQLHCFPRDPPQRMLRHVLSPVFQILRSFNCLQGLSLPELPERLTQQGLGSSHPRIQPWCQQVC